MKTPSPGYLQTGVFRHSNAQCIAKDSFPPTSETSYSIWNIWMGQKRYGQRAIKNPCSCSAADGGQTVNSRACQMTLDINSQASRQDV